MKERGAGSNCVEVRAAVLQSAIPSLRSRDDDRPAPPPFDALAYRNSREAPIPHDLTWDLENEQVRVQREQHMPIDQAPILVGVLGLIVGLGAFAFLLRRSDQGRLR